jgi:hypothetical protein
MYGICNQLDSTRFLDMFGNNWKWGVLAYPQKKTSKNNDKPQDSGVSIPDGGLQMGKSE